MAEEQSKAQAGAKALSEPVRVGGSAAEATLSGGELAWRPREAAGRREAGGWSWSPRCSGSGWTGGRSGSRPSRGRRRGGGGGAAGDVRGRGEEEGEGEGEGGGGGDGERGGRRGLGGRHERSPRLAW